MPRGVRPGEAGRSRSVLARSDAYRDVVLITSCRSSSEGNYRYVVENGEAVRWPPGRSRTARRTGTRDSRVVVPPRDYNKTLLANYGLKPVAGGMDLADASYPDGFLAHLYGLLSRRLRKWLLYARRGASKLSLTQNAS